MTIYDKYGGFEFWHDCVWHLYLDMGDHPEIGHHFLGVNLERLSRKQAEFLVSHIGGPDLYKGPPISVVHKAMDISEFQFEAIAESFTRVFRKKGVEEQDVVSIMSFIASFKKDIVETELAPIDRVMIPIYRFAFKNLKFLLGNKAMKSSSWLRSGKLSNKFD